MFDFLEYLFSKNYYRNKGQALLLKGYPEKAYPYLEKALLLENNSSNMYNLSLALLSMQKYEEAEAYLASTVRESPGNALAVLTLADLYMQKREWEKAKEIFEKLCEAYPSNTHYRKYLNLISDPTARDNYIKAKDLLNKARTHLEENNHKQAIQDLLKAAKLDPENPYIQSNLGLIYLQITKDSQKAFEHLHKAYTLNPENKSFQKNLEIARNKIAK